MVEDNAGDVYLLRSAIESSGFKTNIRVMKDGEQATKFFDEADRDASVLSPDLVVLDLNLPKKRGGEVLEHLRRSRRCQDARVIIVSTSNLELEKETAAKSRADAYFRKPSEFDEFLKLGGVIKTLFAK